MTERVRGKSTHGYRGKYFDIRVKLYTGETFPFRDTYNDMKVRDIKSKMEFVTGIPCHLQRLTYLDSADMMDDSDIKHHDIVPGAAIQLDVWYTWKPLIRAAAEGEIDQVMKLGVTHSIPYNTPSSDVMSEKSKAAWIRERAFVALCVAAHRGHVDMLQRLLNGGANVHDKTPNGRTPLHIAAAQGKNSAVEVLLHNWATIEDPDHDGHTPLVLAGIWDHKTCERQIFLFQWQQRAAKHKPRTDNGELMAHQMYDSHLKTWLCGEYSQRYQTQILPPGEFSGTGISAPRRPRASSVPREGRRDGDDRSSMYSKDTGTQVAMDRKARMGGSRNSSGSSKGEGKKDRASAGKAKSAGDAKQQAFERWLSEKKAKEDAVAERKRQENQKKKMKDEDERRATSAKEKSYETWLKEQKAAGKGRGRGRTVYSPERGISPDEKGGFDLMKIRKEMDILHPVHVT